MVVSRRMMYLGAAALLSSGAVFLTQQWLQGQLSQATASARAGAAPAAAEAQVLVAAQALPPGTILKPSHVRWQAWPADAPTAGYLTSAASGPAQIAGAVVRGELQPGQPLTTTGVVQPGDRSFLAAVLKPGHRAVTVNVSAASGVAGFIFPGDRVDLVLSRRIGDDRHVSETVLTDVRVVGIDQRVANEKQEVVVPQTATLEVTPKQAEIVALMPELGKLSLSLRSLATDAGEGVPRHAVSRTWDSEATGLAPPRPAAPTNARPVRRPAASVVVVRGNTISTVGGAE